MKKYTFKVKEHEEYGGLGFTPSWYPNGDPLPGMTVAHDILEHFPKDDGSAEGEFLALGAALYIRGETGYMQRNGNVNGPKEHLAADLPMVWDYHTNRDRRTTIKPCGLVRDEDLMEQCREIVQIGVRNMRDEDRQAPDAETQERIARWIAKGYKRASVRYAKHGAYEIAYSVFQKIEEQADRCLRGAEEGMILTVSLNLNNLNVSVDCDYPQDEY